VEQREAVTMSMQETKKRPRRGTASEVAGNIPDKIEKKKQMDNRTAISVCVK
jgi:hypothetical protein